jgi:hypothetical protein
MKVLTPVSGMFRISGPARSGFYFVDQKVAMSEPKKITLRKKHMHLRGLTCRGCVDFSKTTNFLSLIFVDKPNFSDS